MRLALCALLAACATPTDLRLDEDYRQWPDPILASGFVAGHNDSYRTIYVNAIARTFPGVGHYPDGTILVKEIRFGSFDAAIDHIEIMRRLGDPPPSLADQAGWMFTEAKTPLGEEVEKSTCWRRCHVTAPFAGAWLDYGGPTPP